MKRGSIRFHSTKVSAEKSLGEVGELLRQYGAQRFEQVWDGFGGTEAVRFNLPVPDAEFGFMAVVLRPKMDALRARLKSEHRIDDPEQVNRVAWRQLKGILEGILLAVDSGMFSTGQIFLGMAETANGGTFWDAMRAEESLMLAAGDVEEVEAILIPPEAL